MEENQNLHEEISEVSRQKELYTKISRSILNMEIENTRNFKPNSEKEMANKTLSLTEYLVKGLRKLPKYTLYSNPNPCGIVAFAHRVLPSETIAEWLSEQYAIATRGGLHCAPSMHEALGTQDGGLVRVSLSHDNNHQEIDRLLSALSAM